MSGAALNRGESKQDYETPLEFIAAVMERFGVPTFDLAASDENALAPRHYTEKDDSLSKDWHRHKGLLWLNPPYAHVTPWVRKCAVEWSQGAHIAALVRASVGSEWFAKFVEGKALVMPLRPRLTFVGEPNPYPADLMLCVYAHRVGFETWLWTEEPNHG